MRLVAVLACTVMLICLGIAPGHAQKRVALLIGNQAYKAEVGPLGNPHNDIALMEKTLKGLGFEVTALKDAGLAAFNEALNAYLRRVKAAGPDAIGLFYYSGHGASDGTTDYLIPTDVVSADASKLWDQSVRVTEITSKLRAEAKNATHFVVFDACRNTLKLTKPGTRTPMQSSGFLPLREEAGMLIAFATAEGELASDPTAGVGPYARALAEEMVKPGVEAVSMFRRVQLRLRAAVGQEPWLGFGALGKVYLAGLAPAEPSGAGTGAQSDDAAQAWALFGNTTSVALLEEFIRRFGDSFYADIARARLDELRKTAAVAPPTRPALPMPPPPSLERPAVRVPPPSRPPAALPHDSAVSDDSDREQTAAKRDRLRERIVGGESRIVGGSQSIDRYPTIEASDRVAAGSTIPVVVSLTVEKLTPDVVIGATGGGVTRTPEGGLAIPIPADRDRIPIGVTVIAPGFDFHGPQTATIEVDRNGDSTQARFDITARESEAGRHLLRVSFWRDGEFLVSTARKIDVLQTSAANRQAGPAPSDRLAPEPVAPRPPDNDVAVSLSTAERRPIDLTVEVVYDDPRTLSGGSITLASPYLPRPVHGRFEGSPDLAKWIELRYGEFRAMGSRAAQPIGGTPTTNAAPVGIEARVGRLRSFGEELYRRAAPPPLKKTLQALLGNRSITLRSVQIYSNNPLVPWELMRAPKPDGGSTDFFGIAFALARWHEDDDRVVVRPLQNQSVDEVVTVAPAYSGRLGLAAPSHEVDEIQSLMGTRRVVGRRQDFVSLLQHLPSGVVHFAGHGEVTGPPADRRFAIKLEDGTFDVIDWRGLPLADNQKRTLFFFNACDVGQAESIAGAVDGWAPAVLARGAAGYIGGLWPISDDPAARFAVAFYGAVKSKLAQTSRASVAEALAQARRLVYETGDPTFLAYAYYGDAQLQLVRLH